MEPKYPVIGPDISFYQKDDTDTPINFDAMLDDADFIILRAGQGNWEDKQYKASYAGAGKAGIPRGAYWYYDNRYDPKRQAELFAKIINETGPLELEAWVDIEQREYITPTPYVIWNIWKKWYDFIERLKQLTTVRIGVYTGPAYWEEFTRNVPAENLAYFKKYPLWIAHYTAEGEAPIVPAPWTAWTYWQFTDSGPGREYGVQSNEIDLNLFAGTLEDFRARYNLNPTDTPQKEETMYAVEVKLQYKTNLREFPNTDNVSLATYAAGSIAQGNQIETLITDRYKGTTKIAMAGDQWLKVEDVNGAPKAGYVALKHMGKTAGYPIIIRDNREPVPPTEPPTPPAPPINVDMQAITVTGEITADRKLRVFITDPNNLPLDVIVVNGKQYGNT